LNIKKCKKHPDAIFYHPTRGEIFGDFCYLDYLICVTSRNERHFDFYIFSRGELNEIKTKIENKSKRFSHASHRILIPLNPYSKKGILYNDFDLELAKDKTNFKGRWDKIKT